MWSLGVEEQFYIFWPLALIVLTKLLSKNKVIISTIIFLVISFGLYFKLRSHASFVFYMPFTRAFELLFGAVLALNYSKIKSFKINFSVATSSEELNCGYFFNAMIKALITNASGVSLIC